jgi:hypothetical protein
VRRSIARGVVLCRKSNFYTWNAVIVFYHSSDRVALWLAFVDRC